MKVILSGGGTGGHIYPALTIADEIKRLNPKAEISFVGTKEGLEKDIIPRYGYPLKFIEVAGFKRSLSLDTLRSVGKLFSGSPELFLTAFLSGRKLSGEEVARLKQLVDELE